MANFSWLFFFLRVELEVQRNALYGRLPYVVREFNNHKSKCKDLWPGDLYREAARNELALPWGSWLLNRCNFTIEAIIYLLIHCT